MPLPFSHVVLVGRPAGLGNQCNACARTSQPHEAVQTADQHRVLFVLLMKPTTVLIQRYKQTKRWQCYHSPNCLFTRSALADQLLSRLFSATSHCDTPIMSRMSIAHSHPSHHPPNTIPPPSDAPSLTTHSSEDLTPFVDVSSRKKKTNKSNQKANQQTTLLFAATSATTSPLSALVVSSDIKGRVEETTVPTSSKSHAERRSTGREPAHGLCDV